MVSCTITFISATFTIYISNATLWTFWRLVIMSEIWGGKREPQKIPPFRIVEFFGGVVRGMTTRQRLPHLSEALWRDAETPGNSATPVPGPQ